MKGKLILTRNSIAVNNHQLYYKGVIVEHLYDALNPYVVVKLDDNILIFNSSDLEEYHE
ncbi:MAG: hypothetical protein J6S67_18715 [Methanobrevibacter sp.]|nr:hypothetical protein [Methanobrevibacter sp.]